MSSPGPTEQLSPWRRLFEEVRRAAGNRRDHDGIQGSINWLRKQMESRGANPNVVRNIIYRDKGRLADKRVLFEILSDLAKQSGGAPLRAPEIEGLLAPTRNGEAEVLQLLGREKKRAYKQFVDGVRAAEHPKLLIVGRAGSGKTLLLDYVEEALTAWQPRPLRLEFGAGYLSSSLTRLALAVGVAPAVIESKLAKIGVSGAFAVQADAQAEVARTINDAIRAADEPLVLLAHVSRPPAAEESLGGAPLRLNTPEVPRVNTAEWLWLSLFEPLTRLPRVSLLVSMTEVPARVVTAHGGFEEPVRLSPPTIAEARRFVRARLPNLEPRQQEEVARRAGRSYEELRTLTLLAEVRVELPDEGAVTRGESAIHVNQLASLVNSTSDERLADFLTSVAVLSLPEYPAFEARALKAVREHGEETSPLELSFLDQLPAGSESWRPFSRQFGRLLRRNLSTARPERFRDLNLRAARYYREAAELDPSGECATRHVHHLLHGRDWTSLIAWIHRFGIQPSLVRPLWADALAELPAGPQLEEIAHQVASHYVRLGAYDHPDASRAFLVLSSSDQASLRAWALIQRAEGAAARGQVRVAEELLAQCPRSGDAMREVEAALVRATVARWRSSLDEAARLVETVARPLLAGVAPDDRDSRVARAKSAVWAGLIAKDRGDLRTALEEFARVEPGDELVEARVAFQQGDVQLMLGRFDAAKTSLDLAVELSRRNQALIAEQARYLSRRGTLYRRRGEIDLALADFEAARAILADDQEVAEPERAFREARGNEEYALALLADGRFEQAILLFEENISAFEQYSSGFGLDASYRVLRSTLRLALAYLFRSLGQPYRLPLIRPLEQTAAGGDLDHARSLHAAVRGGLADHSGIRLQWMLRRNIRLVGSLMADSPEQAQAEAHCALVEARHPFQEAESLAYLAWASLRAGDHRQALDHSIAAVSTLDTVATAGERSDLGLRAWLTSMSIRGHLHTGESEKAVSMLVRWLSQRSLQPLHEPVLRVFGQTVEDSGRFEALQLPSLSRLLRFEPYQPGGRMRLPDELMARWRAAERCSLGLA
jgi:tetratricopeptide (TPR) repeat protein